MVKIPSSPPPPLHKWTVLVWSACDNDLYACCVNDIDKMERGLTDGVKVLAQVDHRPNPDAAGPHTVHRLELEKDERPLLHSKLHQDFGDADMADPKNLSDFVRWGIKNFPAEKYWLVISDHGDAWKGASEDDGHKSWMSLPQIRRALEDARRETGKTLDLLSFDCCHMASVEVAHELKDEARYLLASQEVMGYLGLPYQTLLGGLAEKTPEQVAREVVQASRENPEDIPTFSALDLGKVQGLTSALGELAQGILQSPVSGEQLRKAVADSQTFWEYRDVHHLAENLALASPDLAESAAKVQSALEAAVVAEQHAPTHPGSHGLQVEVQPDSEERRQMRYRRGAIQRQDVTPRRTEQGSYLETSFARETRWNRVIDKIHS